MLGSVLGYCSEMHWPEATALVVRTGATQLTETAIGNIHNEWRRLGHQPDANIERFIADQSEASRNLAANVGGP